MQKERKAEESFEDYKDRLSKKKKQLRLYCKGRTFYNLDTPYVK